MIQIHDVDQDSDEWRVLRQGIITSSKAGLLVTPSTLATAHNDNSRAVVMELVAERINGFTPASYLGWDMERGKFDEPRARDLYSEHFAPVRRVGFITRDDWGFTIGCSPDGLVGDDGMVEIKSRLPKHHLATVLAGSIPNEYVAQCQTALLVSGRDWLDFVSFSEGMRLWVKRVHPEPEWQSAIVQAVREVEAASGSMIAAYEEATSNFPITERAEPIEEEIRF